MLARVAAAILGAWLMAAPALLGYRGVARTHDRIVGPIVITIAITAMSGVVRQLRWVNVAIAAWLLVAAPWLLHFDGAARTNALLVGVMLGIVSLVRGPVDTEYGGGWRAIFTDDR